MRLQKSDLEIIEQIIAADPISSYTEWKQFWLTRVAMAEHLASGFLVPERMVWDTGDSKHLPGENSWSAQTVATIVMFSLNRLRCQEAKTTHRAKGDREAAEGNREFRKRVSSALPNAVLPLHWIVHQDKRADFLQVSADCKQQLHDLFSWCRSFTAAFYGGRDKLFEWFIQEGFLDWHGSHHRAIHGPAATWTVFQEELEYLYDEEDWDSVLVQGSRLVDNGNGVEQVVLNSNDHKMRPPWPRKGTVQQQMAEQTIALLVKIPICKASSKPGQTPGRTASGCGADDQPSDQVVGAVFEHQISIPSIRPRLNGGYDILSQDTTIPVQTFAFTVPRIHFLLTCSEAWSVGGQPGFNAAVELTGAQGSGKSTTLSALSSALAIGSQVDMWFVPNARDLAAPGTVAFANVLTMSTGELTTSVHTDDANRIPDRDGKSNLEAESALQKWWRTVRGCEHKWEINEATMRLMNSCGPDRFVVILDEVQDLLGHARASENSASVKSVREFLRWGEETRKGVLRIRSANPDEPREEFSEHGGQMFFELRPPRASHMAAIMSAAASRLAPSVHVPTQETLDAARMLNVCQHFAGNMRYLTRLLVSASKVKHSSTADLMLHIEKLANRYFDEYSHILAERIVKCLCCHSSDMDEAGVALGLKISPEPQIFGRDRSVWFRYALYNASLAVRKDPTRADSVAFLFKAIGFAAQAKALATCIGFRDPLRANRELLLQPFFVLNESVEGVFKEQIGLRLSVQRLCKFMIPLNALPAIKEVLSSQQRFSQPIQSKRSVRIAAISSPLRKALWVGSGGELRYVYRLFTCLKPLLLSKDILSVVKTCMENNGVLFRTAHTGPFCDFVLYRRCAGNKRQLIFFETMVRTYAEHSSNKSVPMGGQKRPRSARTSTNDPTTHQRCPPELRGLFCLINRPMYMLRREGGDLRFYTPTFGTARGAMSVGNAWLAALGSRARFVSYGPDQAGNWHAELVQNSTDEVWDVHVVFVSAHSLEDQARSAALGKLRCDFAHCVLKEHLYAPNSKAASDKPSTVQ